MLKRLYVHNYKCLVNFEIHFEEDISLFLGANGSGKSTIFEVLDKLKRVLVNEEKVANIFDFKDAPRWLTAEHQKETEIHFELEIESGIEHFFYKYFLIIEFNNATQEPSIKEESLHIDNVLLIQSKGEESTLFIIHPTNPIKIPFENSRSSLSRHPSKALMVNFLRSSSIIRLQPSQMTAVIHKTNAETKTDFANFAAWFAYLNETSRREVSVYEEAMRDILPGFDYFRIEPSGQVKILQVDFKDQANEKKIVSYDFNELSEGQKALVALYALIYCAPKHSLICIDEPENFLALPEIQPWFDTLYDQCVERGLQTLLISHHPKIINFLANDSGYWFSRKNNICNVQRISPDLESGLSIAELVERGWIDEL